MSKENLEMTNATRKLTERERQWNAHGETALAKAWRGEGAWHFINPLLAGKGQKKFATAGHALSCLRHALLNAIGC